MTKTTENYRIAHTMIRVLDIDKTLEFYCEILGMKVLRRNDYPAGRFTNVFIGYGTEEDDPSIELTHNWDDTEIYDKGNGWGHICIEVPDVYSACEELKKKNVTFTRPPGPMNAGTRILAFCRDPDGYSVEINQPLSKMQSTT